MSSPLSAIYCWLGAVLENHMRVVDLMSKWIPTTSVNQESQLEVVNLLGTGSSMSIEVSAEFGDSTSISSDAEN